MPSYIALLRGINVGGKNLLPMKTLAAMVEEYGCTSVKTYIQSGNVLFQSTPARAKSFCKSIREKIEKSHGFRPGILVFSADEFKQATDANPFPDAEAKPNSLHLFFLADIPKRPDLEALNRLKVSSESFQLIGKILYLHAPDGVGRSKLAMQVEKLLGIAATARNWNTVVKLLEMAEYTENFPFRFITSS